MFKGKLICLIIIIFQSSFFLIAQCGQFEELCEKKYNEVVFLTTHNAFNSTEDGFILPNQSLNIEQQLEDGIRGLMLDVYEYENEIVVYHALPQLGTLPLVENLNTIKDFLDANPMEIVTIIFESYVSADIIEATITEAELLNSVYTFDGEWPTLQEMIDADKRLVILSQSNDASSNQAWHHYIWELSTETDFSNHSVEDLDCGFNRGNPENELFLINHFITNADIGTGQIDAAKEINANPFFLDRVNQCVDETGKFPNFIAIDFYEEGDVFEALHDLNAVSDPVHVEELDNQELTVSPNPCSDILNLNYPIKNLNPQMLQVLDLYGNIWIEKILSSNSNTVQISHIPIGTYIVQLKSEKGMYTKTIIKF